MSLAAILRAARPSCRTDADALAFAVHAFMLAQDYKLTAAGAAADGEDPLDGGAPEVGPDGWDGLDGVYAFRYADATASRRPPILLKAAAVGDGLTVTWLLGGAGGGATRGVELTVKDYVAPAPPGAPAAYTALDALDRVLTAALRGGPADADAGGSGAPPTAGGRAPPPGGAPAPPPPGGPHPHPGDADRFPPGLGPGLPGIVHPFPYPGGGIGVGGGGGGSMVGPDDPLFGGHPGAARPRGPWGPGPPPPGLPSGARWDPIRPPGLPGFNPDDFTRPPPPPGWRPPGGPPGGGGGGSGPRPPHPDIMPPGPGGGASGWGGGMFG